MVEIVVLEKGWVTFSANFRGKERPPPTIIGIRKLESLGYRMVKKLPKIATARVGCTNVPDRLTTGALAIAYSELELVHVR